ncbi:MAG TPA: PIN domain-containing protein [Chloroflexota bacterium]|nr:PIN domain-containing protein [Chloroflexota bacterium]
MDVSKLDHLLGDTSRIFLDSSTTIAYHSTAEEVHPLARQVFRRIASDDDPLKGYMSVVSAAELLVRPIRSGAADLTFMHTFLRAFPNLQILPIDLDVSLQAANIRALTKLALPDAFIIASATLAGCEAVVSNDEAWHKRLGQMFPAFRWIYLGGE